MDTASPQQQPRHPIRVVAARTGLSLDVLRVWERRYAAVRPGRGEGGQRLYSDADIERLTLLRRVTQAGRSISQVVGLAVRELEQLIDEDEVAAAGRREDGRDPGARAAPFAAALSTAFAAVEALDPGRLDAALRQATVSLGLHSLTHDVLAPLLQRIGERWRTGELTPAHEHAASAVVHRLLEWITPSNERDGDRPSVVIATPAEERHELGAMLAAAAARAVGWRVIYLGADLPVESIGVAARQTGAACVALSIVYPDAASRFLRELPILVERVGGDLPIIVGGRAAELLERELEARGARVTPDLSSFTELLDGLAPTVTA